MPNKKPQGIYEINFFLVEDMKTLQEIIFQFIFQNITSLDHYML
jgi:hypothetical protein